MLLIGGTTGMAEPLRKIEKSLAPGRRKRTQIHTRV